MTAPAASADAVPPVKPASPRAASRARFSVLVAALVAALVLSILLAVSLGAVAVPLSQSARILAHHLVPGSIDPTWGPCAGPDNLGLPVAPGPPGSPGRSRSGRSRGRAPGGRAQPPGRPLPAGDLIRRIPRGGPRARARVGQHRRCVGARSRLHGRGGGHRPGVRARPPPRAGHSVAADPRRRSHRLPDSRRRTAMSSCARPTSRRRRPPRVSSSGSSAAWAQPGGRRSLSPPWASPSAAWSCCCRPGR